MITRRLNGHDMTFGQGLANLAKDAEAVGQQVKTRLLLLAEEWFLDTEAGVPYLQQIATKPANLPLASSLIKQRILETEGVAEIIEFGMLFDSETRRLTVNAKVRTTYDDISPIKVNLL